MVDEYDKHFLPPLKNHKSAISKTLKYGDSSVNDLMTFHSPYFGNMPMSLFDSIFIFISNIAPEKLLQIENENIKNGAYDPLFSKEKGRIEVIKIERKIEQSGIDNYLKELRSSPIKRKIYIFLTQRFTRLNQEEIFQSKYKEIYEETIYLVADLFNKYNIPIGGRGFIRIIEELINIENKDEWKNYLKEIKDQQIIKSQTTKKLDLAELDDEYDSDSEFESEHESILQKYLKPQ